MEASAFSGSEAGNLGHPWRHRRPPASASFIRCSSATARTTCSTLGWPGLVPHGRRRPRVPHHRRQARTGAKGACISARPSSSLFPISDVLREQQLQGRICDGGQICASSRKGGGRGMTWTCSTKCSYNPNLTETSCTTAPCKRTLQILRQTVHWCLTTPLRNRVRSRRSCRRLTRRRHRQAALHPRASRH